MLIIVVLFLVTGASEGQTALDSQPQAELHSGTTRLSPYSPTPVWRVEAYSLPAEKEKKATSLAKSRALLHFGGYLYWLIVFTSFLLFRLGSKLSGWVEKQTGRRSLQAIILLSAVLLLLDVLEIPFAVAGHYLSLKYELSVEGWAPWLWDLAKGDFLELLIGVPLLWGFYFVVRRSPRKWWVYSWLCGLLVVVFLVLITPALVDPLFDSFEPLSASHPEIVDALEKVVRHGGLAIPPERMFEMKASEKTRTLNAYVTGLGATKRVVVWDTTLSTLTVPQTLFVFGHEMGHYVLNHVWKGIAFASLMLFIGIYVLFRSVTYIVSLWGPYLSISSSGSWSSLPLILLLTFLLSVIGEPLGNMFSRYLEHEADVFGLEVTHGINDDSEQVAAQSFQILGETALEPTSPNRFVVFWSYSHPPIADRINFALTYDPWDFQGQEPEFVR